MGVAWEWHGMSELAFIALSVKLYCSYIDFNVFFSVMKQNLWPQLIADPQDQKETAYRDTGITTLWRKAASVKVRVLAGHKAANRQSVTSQQRSFKLQSVSSELQTSWSINQTVLHQTVNLKPCKIQLMQSLSEGDKVETLAFCEEFRYKQKKDDTWHVPFYQQRRHLIGIAMATKCEPVW
jgi:hypothetical protein